MADRVIVDAARLGETDVETTMRGKMVLTIVTTKGVRTVEVPRLLPSAAQAKRIRTIRRWEEGSARSDRVIGGPGPRTIDGSQV